ncbi:hypothetical protein MWU78_05555 [Arenibacter sp. F26102]|uniref:hypothetical protein n=1 Tax=Arenibacter sp. F26102 TaxID=2926416 RepID=UPI001FF17757|nr:hypothetical protein [Arenibacter sp. F26102]MCK0145106.1 hypothetical protein [Arenibacter sp. F26102]
MKYLLTSLIALLLACSSYPKKSNLERKIGTTSTISNPYFSDMAKDYVYKAKINFGTKSFGGIFAVKKLGEGHHRVVFTTEMGNKLFDFSFIKNEFKINFILDEMNKKILINLLKRDFHVLTNENPEILNHYDKPGDTIFLETRKENKTYFYLMADQQLHRILETRGGEEKSDYIFTQIEDNHAREINIRHNNIKLTIDLKAI